MLIFHSGMRVKHINSEQPAGCLCLCVLCALTRVSKTFSAKLTCSLSPFQAHFSNQRQTNPHGKAREKKKEDTPSFCLQVESPFAQTTLRLITSRFTLRRRAASICCCCWQITWKVLLASETSPPVGLSAPVSRSWCSPYLLVLFIADFFSSAALLRHWLSVQASERVPRAPCLTPAPPPTPSNSFSCPPSASLPLDSRKHRMESWRRPGASTYLPTDTRAGFHTAQRRTNACHLSSHSLCLSGDVYEAPAGRAESPEEKKKTTSVCAELKVFHLSCSAQTSQHLKWRNWLWQIGELTSVSVCLCVRLCVFVCL